MLVDVPTLKIGKKYSQTSDEISRVFSLLRECMLIKTTKNREVCICARCLVKGSLLFSKLLFKRHQHFSISFAKYTVHSKYRQTSKFSNKYRHNISQIQTAGLQFTCSVLNIISTQITQYKRHFIPKRSVNVIINLILPRRMMTSSNGNIFRVTGHLCGEFTGHR